jgi:hypothetical protein
MTPPIVPVERIVGDERFYRCQTDRRICPWRKPSHPVNDGEHRKADNTEQTPLSRADAIMVPPNKKDHNAAVKNKTG